MENLFEDAISQAPDDNGKTRVLNYDINGEILSFMISPIAPVDLPIDFTLRTVSLQTALQFISEKNLTLEKQDGNKEDGIQGLWVSSTSIYYGYISIEVSPPIKDIDFSEPTKNDPMRTDTTSVLETYKMSRKIAEYLKIYALYTYSRDPENFGPESFFIDPDHLYDIDSLNKKFVVNEIMYTDDEKLIVNSEDIKQRLLNYVKVSVAFDKSSVLSLSKKSSVDYYQNISDFRPSQNQLIFFNKSGILKWKQELKRKDLYSKISRIILDPEEPSPYFYKNNMIQKGKLAIIQNVLNGSLTTALAVSLKWEKDRINVGFNPKEVAVENISYKVYTEEGLIEEVKRESKETAKVLLIAKDLYSALLFLKT